VERPRRVGANKSGTDIAADEHVQRDVQLGFEQKRDRYNGFDASDYGRVVDKFEAAEQLKEEVAKKRELEKTFNPEGGKETNETSAGAENSDSDSESDGEKGKGLSHAPRSASTFACTRR
jgi:pre-mRNA-processing factor SLU7